MIAYNTNIVRDGLVLHLDAANVKSYPGSGTTLYDVSGNSLNASALNGASYISGNNGTVSLDGVNDCMSFNRGISETGPYSVIQWIKPNVALVPGGSGASKPNGANRKTTIVGPGPIWSPGIWVTSDYIRVHAKTQYVDSAINWTTTTWQMIGMTYDGTNCQVIFGDQILPIAFTTTITFSNTSVLLVGAENTGGSVYNWNGEVGPVMLYNKVLSTGEIKQNFEAIRGRYGI